MHIFMVTTLWSFYMYDNNQGINTQWKSDFSSSNIDAFFLCLAWWFWPWLSVLWKLKAMNLSIFGLCWSLERSPQPFSIQCTCFYSLHMISLCWVVLTLYLIFIISLLYWRDIEFSAVAFSKWDDCEHFRHFDHTSFIHWFVYVHHHSTLLRFSHDHWK